MKKLTQKYVDMIIRKCINLAIRKPPEFFNLKKMKKDWGSCNWVDIDLDPRSTILGTGLHECVHYLYPNWCETQVLYAESRILNQANPFDLARFLKHLAIKIYRTEKRKNLINSKKKRRRITKKKKR